MLKTLVAFALWLLALSGPVRAETVAEIEAAMRGGCNPALQEKSRCDFSKECNSDDEFMKWQSCQQDCERQAEAADKYNEFVRECKRKYEENERKANNQLNKGKPPGGPSATMTDWSKLKAAADKKAENADAKNAANLNDVKEDFPPNPDDLAAARKKLEEDKAKNEKHQEEVKRTLPAPEDPIIPPAKPVVAKYPPIPQRLVDRLSDNFRLPDFCRDTPDGYTCAVNKRFDNEAYDNMCFDARGKELKTFKVFPDKHDNLTYFNRWGKNIDVVCFGHRWIDYLVELP